MEKLMNKPAFLILSKGTKVSGEFTGFSNILNCYMFSAYNGDIHRFNNLNNLIVK